MPSWISRCRETWKVVGFVWSIEACEVEVVSPPARLDILIHKCRTVSPSSRSRAMAMRAEEKGKCQQIFCQFPTLHMDQKRRIIPPLCTAPLSARKVVRWSKRFFEHFSETFLSQQKKLQCNWGTLRRHLTKPHWQADVIPRTLLVEMWSLHIGEAYESNWSELTFLAVYS